MNFIRQEITEWLTELLLGGIISKLTGMFDGLNEQVAETASNVDTTP